MAKKATPKKPAPKKAAAKKAPAKKAPASKRTPASVASKQPPRRLGRMAGRLGRAATSPVGLGAMALMPGGPVQSLVESSITPAKSKPKKRPTGKQLSKKTFAADKRRRAIASADKARLSGRKSASVKKVSKDSPAKGPGYKSTKGASKKVLGSKAAGMKSDGPARTVAEAQKRKLSTFTNKAGKKLAAVTKEQLTAWEKKTGKKGLRAYLNAKK